MKKCAFLNKSAFFQCFFAQKFAYIKNFLYLCSGFRNEGKTSIQKSVKSLGEDLKTTQPERSPMTQNNRTGNRVKPYGRSRHLGETRLKPKSTSGKAHLQGSKERRWTGSSRTPGTVVLGRLINGGMATLQPNTKTRAQSLGEEV